MIHYFNSSVERLAQNLMFNDLARFRTMNGRKIAFLVFLLFSTLSANAQNYWSNPSSWPGNAKPLAGENVTIPLGTTIILDENTPDLGGLTILGTLEFAHQNLSLSASWIMLQGTLQVGTPLNLFTHKATITLTGSDVNENIMGMGTRGIMVMGGQLELHAATPNIIYTKLNQHAAANATSINVIDNTHWQVGDEIAIAPTDYYLAGNGASVTQRVSVSSINTNTLNISQPLNAFRWGLLQYVTPNGLSLDSSNRVLPPKPDTDSTFTPTVLDERAVIANLTRNIVIQAPNDPLWQNQGFGVHVMIMGTGAQAHLNGVEIKRGGQRNRLGRYPFHWHMLSYSGTSTLADATGQYIRNSVINSSTNRGIVIHGTNGVLVRANVVYDILGHGIFTEDAVERRNVIDSNVVLHVRNTTPTALPILKVHEGNNSSDFGSSGFWISNPDNTITNNIAADCGAFGYWLAYTTQPWGESMNVLHIDGLLLNPSRLLFGVFNNNTAHSCRHRGIMLDLVESSTAGDVVAFQYQSTTDGRNPTWPNTTLRRFTVARCKLWKNGHNGFWDRAVWPTNYEFVSADNCGRFFAGSGADGIIERSLVIGTSLNHLMNGTDRPNTSGETGVAAFATYHSAFDIRDNIVVNCPAINNINSGAFATNDYYLRPVDKGLVRNINNLLIQSHPGVKLAADFSHFKLAGALWDPNGNWNNGIVDSSKYFVYNEPFFTYNEAITNATGGSIAGGVLVNGPFYGINDFEINRANDPQQDLMALNVNRLSNTFDSVANWQVAQAGNVTWLLAHMRHFAAKSGGMYDLTFPTIDTVNDVACSIENMLTTNDSLILAVEYHGDYAINQVYISSWPNFMDPNHANWPTSYAYKHVYQAVGSRNQVINSAGETYWHDRANNKVWIKIKGGIQQIWNDTDYSAVSDQRLYRLFHLRIFGTHNPIAYSVDNQTACNFFTWIDGNTYTTNNNTATYNYVGGASNGSDSIVTLNLTIHSTTGIDVQTACNAFTWIDGNTYTANNNTATFNLVGGASNGCDSLVTLNLTITSVTGIDVQTACNSFTWINGNTYTSNNNSATFNLVGGASNGCDSLVSLNLTIINSASGTDVQTACNSFTWIDGNTYTANNNTATYNIAGGASNGCDSLVSLNLTILNAATGTDVQTACNTFDWIDGNIYTSNNNTATFNLVGGASNGCDSLVTLNLTITTIDTSVTSAGNTLTAIENSAVYQWVDCNNNLSPINNETAQSFTATQNGSYAVIISLGACSDTSSCYTILTTSQQKLLANEKIIVFPNPSNGIFTIQYPSVENTTYSITDISGKLITSGTIMNGKTTIDLSAYENGFYMLQTDKYNLKLLKM
jgi:sorbitol-specific phosphotransferase system component IIA